MHNLRQYWVSLSADRSLRHRPKHTSYTFHRLYEQSHRPNRLYDILKKNVNCDDWRYDHFYTHARTLQKTSDGKGCHSDMLSQSGKTRIHSFAVTFPVHFQNLISLSKYTIFTEFWAVTNFSLAWFSFLWLSDFCDLWSRPKLLMTPSKLWSLKISRLLPLAVTRTRNHGGRSPSSWQLWWSNLKFYSNAHSNWRCMSA